MMLWVQKGWGFWTTYGGGGCLVTITPDPSSAWFVGWEAQHDFSEILTLGAEVFATFDPSERSENEAAFTIGGIINFSDKHHLLLSAGSDLKGHNNIILYAAYQPTIGPASK
jgi:hypothetical protein